MLVSDFLDVSKYTLSSKLDANGRMSFIIQISPNAPQPNRKRIAVSAIRLFPLETIAVAMSGKINTTARNA
jgi:hypothetical protein